MIENIREEVITTENVLRLAELIAIRSVKTVAGYSGGKLDYLYKELVHDVYGGKNPTERLSDGYDVVQTAVCFLLEHLGKKLGDFYKVNKYGKEIDILRGCYNACDNYLTKYKFNRYNSIELDYKDKYYQELQTTMEEIKEDDWTEYDTIISKMNLKNYEIETLNCYMAGMTYCQIARFLNVNFSTIYRRRQSLQRKYLRLKYDN